MILPKVSSVMIAAAACLLASCGPVSEAWSARRDASTANNHMMLVRETPASLGYRRLMVKAAQYGDLQIFLKQTGDPDFMAEASSGDRKYLIFYYLRRHQAFACREKNRLTGEVEFAGPYQMTAGELRLLGAAKKTAGTALAER